MEVSLTLNDGRQPGIDILVGQYLGTLENNPT